MMTRRSATIAPTTGGDQDHCGRQHGAGSHGDIAHFRCGVEYEADSLGMDLKTLASLMQRRRRSLLGLG